LKLFKNKNTKLGFSNVLLKHNIIHIKLSTLRSMYIIHKDNYEYFNQNRRIIYHIICFFNTVTKEKVGKLKNLSRSPSLNNQIERYGEILGLSKYNEMKAKNSKNRLLASEQIKETLKACYGSRNYVNVIKCKETKLKRYGDENYNNLNKMKETCLLKYEVDNVRKSQYFHELMVSQGRNIPRNMKSDYQIYKNLVMRITSKQNIKNLLNSEKQGRLDLKEESYHLDHKISQKYGFMNSILPEIIGSIYNLEFIDARMNCSKQEKCSFSEYELYTLYKKGKK